MGFEQINSNPSIRTNNVVFDTKLNTSFIASTPAAKSDSALPDYFTSILFGGKFTASIVSGKASYLVEMPDGRAAVFEGRKSNNRIEAKDWAKGSAALKSLTAQLAAQKQQSTPLAASKPAPSQNSNPLSVVNSFLEGAYQTTIGIVPALVQDQLNKVEKLRTVGFTLEPWENAKERFAKMSEEFRLGWDQYQQVTQSTDPLGTYFKLVQKNLKTKEMKAKFDRFMANPNAIAQVLGNLTGMVVTGVVTKKVASALPKSIKAPAPTQKALAPVGGVKPQKLLAPAKVPAIEVPNSSVTPQAVWEAKAGAGRPITLATKPVPTLKPAPQIDFSKHPLSYADYNLKGFQAGDTVYKTPQGLKYARETIAKAKKAIQSGDFGPFTAKQAQDIVARLEGQLRKSKLDPLVARKAKTTPQLKSQVKAKQQQTAKIKAEREKELVQESLRQQRENAAIGNAPTFGRRTYNQPEPFDPLGGNHQNNGWSDHPQFAEPPANAPINYSTLLNTPKSMAVEQARVYAELVLTEQKNAPKAVLTKLPNIWSRLKGRLGDVFNNLVHTDLILSSLNKSSENLIYKNISIPVAFTPVFDPKYLKGFQHYVYYSEDEGAYEFPFDDKRITKFDIIRLNIYYADRAAELKEFMELFIKNNTKSPNSLGSKAESLFIGQEVFTYDGPSDGPSNGPTDRINLTSDKNKFLKLVNSFLDTPHYDQLILKHVIELNNKGKPILGINNLTTEDSTLLLRAIIPSFYILAPYHLAFTNLFIDTGVPLEEIDKFKDLLNKIGDFKTSNIPSKEKMYFVALLRRYAVTKINDMYVSKQPLKDLFADLLAIDTHITEVQKTKIKRNDPVYLAYIEKLTQTMKYYLNEW